MNKIISILAVYLVFCSVMAFVDIDWDAESEAAVKASIYKQTLYMNRQQKQVYFDDLGTIDSAGMMGGMNGRRLHGQEASDIHELANDIRRQYGKELVAFPSKPFTEAMTDFVVIPARLYLDRN